MATKGYIRVMGVHGDLIFGGISDETLVVGEGDIGWGGAVALCETRQSVIASMSGCKKDDLRSLAMISTRSFCQTPTQE